MNLADDGHTAVSRMRDLQSMFSGRREGRAGYQRRALPGAKFFE
jgi:hypothetical protein